ncbi:ORF6N domain-containing protein [Methylocella sp.]|uniref:ORF6N domain-containing protein n=1 Tax=Methylocella sp. TaxID=1978226 RepID=UPI003784B9E8
MEHVTSHLAPAAAVQIGLVDVRRIEYRGQQVVTFAMIDKVHGRPEGTAGRTFRENRDRFVEGEDAFSLCNDEIRRSIDAGIFPAKTTQAKFITRRGYLKIVKRLAFERVAPIGAIAAAKVLRGTSYEFRPIMARRSKGTNFILLASAAGLSVKTGGLSFEPGPDSAGGVTSSAALRAR